VENDGIRTSQPHIFMTKKETNKQQLTGSPHSSEQSRACFFNF